ncbi:Pre-mRNA-splicing factor 18, partial [Durusdinium trenchii]
EYFAEKKREEEKWKADEEARMQQLEVHFTKSGQKDQESKKEIPAHLLDEALLADDDAEWRHSEDGGRLL